MKRAIRGVAVLLALLLVTAAGQAEDSAEVKKLLTERRDALRLVAQGRQEEYRAGRGSLEQLLFSYHELRQAELAAASTPAEKVAALESVYRAVSEADERVLNQFKMGFTSKLNVLAVRAERLAVEIDLRRAGGKPPADAKPAGDVSNPGAGKK